MKTNVRNEDAIARAMGWLEQLREDGRAELVSERGGEPVAAGGPAADATARPPNADRGRQEMCEGAVMIEPAPIGDALRLPIAWCEMDSCISRRAVSTLAVLTEAAGSGVIQAVEPPFVPLPAQGRHRESLRGSRRAS
jgi:hypothetical protein